MNAALTERDERTVVVENAGYRWSSLTLSYGLLVIVAVRAFTRGEQPWDLLALVVLAGGVHAAYQASRKVLQRRWVLASALSFVAAAVLALILAVARR